MNLDPVSVRIALDARHDLAQTSTPTDKEVAAFRRAYLSAALQLADEAGIWLVVTETDDGYTGPASAAATSPGNVASDVWQAVHDCLIRDGDGWAVSIARVAREAATLSIRGAFDRHDS
jgi:hypothetical protein